jgi:hypothetical protein
MAELTEERVREIIREEMKAFYRDRPLIDSRPPYSTSNKQSKRNKKKMLTHSGQP